MIDRRIPPCYDCGAWDDEREGCTMPSLDRVYACPLEYEGEDDEECDRMITFNIVTELCLNCENEVSINWDVKKDGYKAFCPRCGSLLMLCTECMLGCDWDDETQSCCQNRRLAVPDKFKNQLMQRFMREE